MKMNRCILMLILLVFCMGPGHAQIDTTLLASQIEEHFRKSPVQGLAVSVVGKGKEHFSWVDGDNLGDPFNADTPVWLGSVSKTMTALGICRLVEMGSLDLEETIHSYLSEKHHFSKGETITIKDLLHHHSGISQEAGYTDKLEYDGELEGMDLVNEAGQEGIYSSANYTILGMIIEQVSRKSYAQFMEDEVFLPLGLEQTFVPTTEQGRAMKGYCFAYGFPVEAHQMKYGKYIIPAGYIVTTLEDMTKYSRFLLGNGQIEKGDTLMTYLSEEVFRSMFTAYNNDEFGYGMSWGIGETLNTKTYSHEGMTKISNAQITILPDMGVAINVVSNTNSGPFFSIASEVSESIIAAIRQQNDQDFLYWEYLIRIAVGLLTLRMIFDLIVGLRKWRKRGYPKKVQFDIRRILAYLSDLVPLLILIFLPKIIHTPISMLLRIMPDYGWAIVVGGVIAMFQLALRLVLGKEQNNMEP